MSNITPKGRWIRNVSRLYAKSTIAMKESNQTTSWQKSYKVNYMYKEHPSSLRTIPLNLWCLSCKVPCRANSVKRCTRNLLKCWAADIGFVRAACLKTSKMNNFWDMEVPCVWSVATIWNSALFLICIQINSTSSNRLCKIPETFNKKCRKLKKILNSKMTS